MNAKGNLPTPIKAGGLVRAVQRQLGVNLPRAVLDVPVEVTKAEQYIFPLKISKSEIQQAQLTLHMRARRTPSSRRHQASLPSI